MGYQECIVCGIASRISEYFGILGLLGIGKRSLNKSNRFTRFMTARSFPFYIFHFGWLVFLQYSLSKIINSTALLYTLSVIGTILLTIMTVEIIGRIPVLRFLFAIKLS
jgi:peptidoglycan/LPS O-acetylase OafA/YrhL